jgi:4-hydroxythreonine-4-phosphate dehydrogenase
MRERPVIGISLGDPQGIGPEVIIKALADPELRALARFVIYGRNDLLTYVAEKLDIHPYWYRVAQESDRAKGQLLPPVTVVDFHDDGDFLKTPLERGPCRESGEHSKRYVEAAINDALLPTTDPRHIDAIVTAPISKQSWALAGFRWPGHTELLVARTKAKQHAMAFTSSTLRVVLASAHVPLMDVKNVLTIGRVFDSIDLGNEFCRSLGIATPTIAVCGLNPHAGEEGLFGDEESRIIVPAIDVARQHGIDARGPFPGDTVFLSALKGTFDLVVAMYHDQGLIPVKLLGWNEAVNVTLGLPIVRTSPDHGTAFDIAGANQADPGSMKNAVRVAIDMAAVRRTTPSA